MIAALFVAFALQVEPQPGPEMPTGPISLPEPDPEPATQPAPVAAPAPVQQAAPVPHTGPQPLLLAVSPFTGEELREDVRKFQATRFANHLTRIGVQIVADPKAADAVVSAQISHMGGTGMKVDLEVTLAYDGKVVAARSIQAMGDRELDGMLEAAAQEIARQLFVRLDREPVRQAEAPATQKAPTVYTYTSTVPGLLVGLAGAIALGGGVVLFEVGGANLADVRDGRPSSYASAQSEASQAQTFNAAGIALIAVGSAALLGGALFAIIAGRLNASLDLTASPYLGPNGSTGFVFGGHF